MGFEAISGASAHLGPPGPKMGPGHSPRSPNDLLNMIFYPLLIDPRSIFGRFGIILGFLSGCSETKTAKNATQTPHKPQPRRKQHRPEASAVAGVSVLRVGGIGRQASSIHQNIKQQRRNRKSKKRKTTKLENSKKTTRTTA